MKVALVLIFLLFLLYLAFGRDAYHSFDHGKWANRDSIPDANAKIVAVTTEKVQYTKNNAKLKTTINFSDGFYFVTHRTNREQHFLSYTISLDENTKAEILRDAVLSHEKAVAKKAKRH